MGNVKREASAVAQVSQLTRWEPLEWWRIEASAWNDEPEVLAALRSVAPTPVRLLFVTGRPSPAAILYLVLGLAAAVAPAVAAFLALRSLVRDDADPLAVAPLGILALAGGVILLVDVLIFARAPQARVAEGSRAVGTVHFVASAVTLAVVAYAAAAGRLGEDAVWIWGVVFDVGVGLTLILLGRRRTPRAGEVQPDPETLDAAVAAVDGARLDAVRSDLDEAIRALRGKGFIDPGSAAMAHATALGSLGMTMAPTAPHPPR